MKRIINFHLIFIITMLLGLTNFYFNFPQNVEAKEDELIYESLSVFVMPQYTTPEDWDSEQPAVFVSLLGSLVNESDKPYLGEIRIPTFSSGSDVHFSLAGKFNDEGVSEELEATLDEKSNEIVWQVEDEIEPGEHYNIVVEYYFAFEHEDSSFEFSFPYQVERKAKIMDMLFFQPYNAEEFTVNGDIGEGVETNSFGITAHKFDLGEVQANTKYDISISYMKNDMVTTLEAIETLIDQANELAELHNGASVEDASSTSPSPSDVELIITSSIGVIVLLLFVFFIVQDYRKHKKRAQIVED